MVQVFFCVVGTVLVAVLFFNPFMLVDERESALRSCMMIRVSSKNENVVESASQPIPDFPDVVEAGEFEIRDDIDFQQKNW